MSRVLLRGGSFFGRSSPGSIWLKHGLTPLIYSSRACSADQTTVGPKKPTSDLYQYRTLDPSHATPRPASDRPLTNEPFIKNLFLGEMDENMLIFPEVFDSNELKELESILNAVDEFVKAEVNPHLIDKEGKIPADLLQMFKDQGFFGLIVPEQYGGLGYNATKYGRILEVTGRDSSISTTLAAHQMFGLKGLLIAGTEEQKSKYLPKLASGQSMAALCLSETHSGGDFGAVETTADEYTAEGCYLLNGTKAWVVNGANADIFTVFAKARIDKDGEHIDHQLTGFIVERGFGGITVGEPMEKMGTRATNLCEVRFDNTKVPVENVLGELGGGFQLATDIFSNGRLSLCHANIGQLKELIALGTEHAIHTNRYGKPLCEQQLVKAKLASLATRLYAMESITYMTAGLIDTYVKPNTSMEVAAAKIFVSENYWECIDEIMHVFGIRSVLKDQHLERCMRDARTHMLFESTNDVLRMTISMESIRHTLLGLGELIGKLKNPLNNVAFNWRERKAMKQMDNPPLKMHLSDHLHPTLKIFAEDLERNIFRFKYTVRDVMAYYETEIISKQLVLAKLANVAIDLYATTAVLARASRSHAIGLRNFEQEILLTRGFCHEANLRIIRNIQELSTKESLEGEILDDIKRRVADTMLKEKGYGLQHAMTKNW